MYYLINKKVRDIKKFRYEVRMHECFNKHFKVRVGHIYHDWYELLIKAVLLSYSDSIKELDAQDAQNFTIYARGDEPLSLGNLLEGVAASEARMMERQENFGKLHEAVEVAAWFGMVEQLVEWGFGQYFNSVVQRIAEERGVSLRDQIVDTNDIQVATT